MFAFFTNLIPAPYRMLALGLAFAAAFSLGGIAGYTARDYFAERKEVRLLKEQIRDRDASLVKWKKEESVQRARAVAAESKHQDNQQQATQQASTVDPSKLVKISMEKCDVETNTVAVEHTDPCHWLQLNAAYAGTAPPVECTRGVPDQVPGEHVPDAGVDREGNRG